MKLFNQLVLRHLCHSFKTDSIVLNFLSKCRKDVTLQMGHNLSDPQK